MIRRLIIGIPLLLGNTQVAIGVEETVKLVPRIRIEEPVKETVLVSTEQLRPFLDQVFVFDSELQFEEMPYIVAFEDGQSQSAQRSTFFAKGIHSTEEGVFDIAPKKGKPYKHPVTKELLGYEAYIVGTAELKKVEDLATMQIVKAKEPIDLGSRLIPTFATELPVDYVLTPGKASLPGFILSSKATENILGLNDVVMISLGKREGLEEGNYLDIYREGASVPDPMSKSFKPKKIILPDRKIGRVLVYKTYEKLSVALITEASDIIQLYDVLKNP